MAGSRSLLVAASPIGPVESVGDVVPSAYQALIRAGDDALAGRPEVPMERISFTVLLAAATVVGTIGHAALGDLLPAHRRQRVKARTRKNPTSKYGPNAGQHPHKAQNYTVHTTVAFFAQGLNSRSGANATVLQLEY